jgi:hypothetical protein
MLLQCNTVNSAAGIDNETGLDVVDVLKSWIHRIQMES